MEQKQKMRSKPYLSHIYGGANQLKSILLHFWYSRIFLFIFLNVIASINAVAVLLVRIILPTDVTTLCWLVSIYRSIDVSF